MAVTRGNAAMDLQNRERHVTEEQLIQVWTWLKENEGLQKIGVTVLRIQLQTKFREKNISVGPLHVEAILSLGVKEGWFTKESQSQVGKPLKTVHLPLPRNVETTALPQEAPRQPTPHEECILKVLAFKPHQHVEPEPEDELLAACESVNLNSTDYLNKKDVQGVIELLREENQAALEAALAAAPPLTEELKAAQQELVQANERIAVLVRDKGSMHMDLKRTKIREDALIPKLDALVRARDRVQSELDLTRKEVEEWKKKASATTAAASMAENLLKGDRTLIKLLEIRIEAGSEEGGILHLIGKLPKDQDGQQLNHLMLAALTRKILSVGT